MDSSLSARPKRVALLCAAALLALGGRAEAQTAGATPTATAAASGGIEEIVVTARKRDERLQDIPVAVSALTAQQIQQQGIKSLADVAALTPGLTYDEGISKLDTRPAIRGLYVQRGRPSVAILQDGFDVTSESIVSAGGGSLINQNLLDVERIEVVEGPQSVLYGRSAFGGAVNYITRRPADTFEGQVDLEVGSYGTYKAFGTVSGPIVPDKLLFRLSAEGDGNDGYYTNAKTGRQDLNGSDSKGVSLDLELRATDQLTIRARGEYSQQNERQRAAVNLPSNALLPNNCIGVARYSCSAALTLPQVVGQQTASESQVAYTDDYPGTRSTTYRGTLNVDYDLGWASFTAMSSILQDRTKLTQDTDYEPGPNPLATFTYEDELQDLFQDTTQVSQELRLASGPDSPFKWLGGFLFFYEDVKVNDRTQYTFDRPVASNPYAPRALRFDSAQLSPSIVDRRTYHESAFGSISYEFLPDLTFTAEIRLAMEQLHASKPFQSRTSISTYTGGISYGPNGVPLGVTYVSGSIDSYYTNPRFSLDYKIDPDKLVYFTFAKGTKPGGFSLLNIGNSTLDAQRFAPEKLLSYELGAKTDWLDHTLRVNAAVYFNDYHDQQVSLANTNVQPPITYVGNAGKVFGIGEELSVTYKPIPELTLNLNYNHLDEYYQSYISDVANDRQFLPGGSYADKSLPSVPEHTLSVIGRYERPVYDGIDGFFQVSATYESVRYGNQYNTWTFGGYIQPNLQLGVETDRWSALFYMNNVFDDRTARSAISYFDLHRDFRPTALLYLPDPRVYGVRTSYKF